MIFEEFSIYQVKMMSVLMVKKNDFKPFNTVISFRLRKIGRNDKMKRKIEVGDLYAQTLPDGRYGAIRVINQISARIAQ
jgi:hypothetical protein